MRNFVFQWPAVLLLLLLIIPIFWLLRRARRRRLEIIASLDGTHPTQRRLRDGLRVVAFALLIFAFARPGYDPQSISAPKNGRDVVFALDVSQSMLAQDVLPSRLEVAKQGIRDAVDGFAQERVGLVAYAGSASILCPLTSDYEFVRYMLEQAYPRTVDFGGTAVQAAIEKAGDQVFIQGREGLQDLIIITDGGDNASQMDKVIVRLNEKAINVLIIGIGNPDTASPIPITNEEGEPALLQSKGNTVYTQLEDASLREFAAQSEKITYLPIGTQAFNLANLYKEYAQALPTEDFRQESGLLVYKEAALFFMIPALILLLFSECWTSGKLRFGHTMMLCLSVWILSESSLEAATVDEQINIAEVAFNKGDYENAEAQFSELYIYASNESASRAQLAPIQFNRGLCLLQLAASSIETDPRGAKSLAQRAETAFLSAKRYAPELQRAGIRLEDTGRLISEAQAIIEAEQEVNAALQAKLDELIEMLQTLLEKQTKLRSSFVTANAEQTPNPFVEQQTRLREASGLAQEFMRELDIEMNPPTPGLPPIEGLLTEPLRQMQPLRETQTRAINQLTEVETWKVAKRTLPIIERKIEAILELLSNSSDDYDEESEEYDDMEDYYDYMDESEESMNSSEAMEGDFSSSSEMQALPTPNYSAEDILLEEQGSLQFRQQKRASANANEVEMDY